MFHALVKSSLSLVVLIHIEVSDGKVVLSCVAVELVSCLLVKLDLLVVVLYESSCAEKCSLVENVDVLLDKLEKLVVCIVLELYVSDESCATELWKNLLSKSLEVR